MKKRIIVTESQMKVIQESLNGMTEYSVDEIDGVLNTNAPDGTYEKQFDTVLIVVKVTNGEIYEILNGQSGADLADIDIDVIESVLNHR